MIETNRKHGSHIKKHAFCESNLISIQLHNLESGCNIQFVLHSAICIWIMDPDERVPGTSAGTIIGWCVLAAGIGQIPLIVVGLRAAPALPKLGSILLLFGLPSGLLLFLGGLGLIYRQFAGYYCVYLATFFAGIGGFKNPYIPLIKRFINFGPGTEDLFLALNLLLVAILAFEHWCRLGNLELPRQKTHRTWLIALMALGLCSVSIGRAMIHRERGEKTRAADLPVVGAALQDFQTAGKLAYVSVETRFPRGISSVFSGTSTQPAVMALAEAHHLKRMDDSAAHKKFLPQVRAWKLNETIFPSQFAPDDLYYVGRLKTMPKVVIEIVYRNADGRFTVQIFGVTGPD
jgi:hypothetical protein